MRYEVFIHLAMLEDYSTASYNLHEATTANFVPVRRPYIWRYGLVDGVPPDAIARSPL